MGLFEKPIEEVRRAWSLWDISKWETKPVGLCGISTRRVTWFNPNSDPLCSWVMLGQPISCFNNNTTHLSSGRFGRLHNNDLFSPHLIYTFTHKKAGRVLDTHKETSHSFTWAHNTGKELSLHLLKLLTPKLKTK